METSLAKAKSGSQSLGRLTVTLSDGKVTCNYSRDKEALNIIEADIKAEPDEFINAVENEYYNVTDATGSNMEIKRSDSPLHNLADHKTTVDPGHLTNAFEAECLDQLAEHFILGSSSKNESWATASTSSRQQHSAEPYNSVVTDPSSLVSYNGLQVPNIEPFTCDACPQSFSDQKALSSHKRIHKRFDCEECPKTFIRKRDLLRHKDYHIVNPVKCKQCEFRCPASEDLLPHVIKVHWGKYPYKCSECDSRFQERQQLVQHRFVHSTVTEFNCAECGKVLKTRDSLLRHKNIVHKGIKSLPCYSCKICSESFRRKEYFRRHMKMHHNQVYF